MDQSEFTYDIGECGDGLSPHRPSIQDVAPWQMHQGWVEDAWSGRLTQDIVAILKPLPVFKDLVWTTKARNTAGPDPFWHWGIGLKQEVVWVDFVGLDGGDDQVTLMFNQERLITAGQSVDAAVYRFPVQAHVLIAFAVGVWLSYKHCVIFGLNWSLEPIVRAFWPLLQPDDAFAAALPREDFEAWMKNFFYLVMGFNPEFVYPPYRMVVYGGDAV